MPEATQNTPASDRAHTTPEPASLETSFRPQSTGYRGRIAPTPTGLLHLGHAQTFRTAWQRARAAGGTLIYREENLDPLRCTQAYAQAAIEDLRRYGLDWDEGPDCTPQGPHAPYSQSGRTGLYRRSLAQLIRSGHAYPDAHSRNDLARALANGLAQPSPPLFGEQDTEAIFLPQWRPADSEWFANAPLREAAANSIETADSAFQTADSTIKTASSVIKIVGNSIKTANNTGAVSTPTNAVTWRFRVPDGESLSFIDGGFGEQSFTAGRDFGDFVLWRRDAVPAYELAVVADDIAMGITEVVRGADLLRSTCRQLLLYRALGATPPAFFHCPLVLDPHTGKRLAKRSESLSLRALLDSGWQGNH